MTKLSVNINKIATIRNARGGETPNLVNIAKLCEEYGADGITVHPRPDERHIRQKDVYDLAAQVTTEFNIEDYLEVAVAVKNQLFEKLSENKWNENK